MRDRWSNCIDTVGGESELSIRWNNLTDEQKARYKGDNEAERYQRFATDQVLNEVKTRDWRWLYTGDVPSTTHERGAKPLDKERYVGRALNLNGYSVEFIKEVNKTRIKTADAKLNSIVWEFKVPEGYNGEHTVRAQFWKARDKGTSKLLISCTKNHAPSEDVCKWVHKTFEKGDYEYIDEVLVMADDGRLTRIKRLK